MVALLVEAGVDADRLQFVGHGEANPASPGDLAANRRVELTVIGADED